jgi:uncharacterized protein (TIGR02284 family)
MTTSNEEVITTLNNLIVTCRDGEAGFKTAAKGIGDPQIRLILGQCARQRADFATALQYEVRVRGGNPETGGSVSGALNRGWLDIKAAVLGADEGAIISECERGEDLAIAAYKDALNSSLPTDLASLIKHQYGLVSASHHRIRSLEKATV